MCWHENGRQLKKKVKLKWRPLLGSKMYASVKPQWNIAVHRLHVFYVYTNVIYLGCCNLFFCLHWKDVSFKMPHHVLSWRPPRARYNEPQNYNHSQLNQYPVTKETQHLISLITAIIVAENELLLFWKLSSWVHKGYKWLWTGCIILYLLLFSFPQWKTMVGIFPILFVQISSKLV